MTTEDMFKPKLQIKNNVLGKDTVNNFKVRPEVHKKLKELAAQHDIAISDVVRQMIDFAMEHL